MTPKTPIATGCQYEGSAQWPVQPQVGAGGIGGFSKLFHRRQTLPMETLQAKATVNTMLD